MTGFGQDLGEQTLLSFIRQAGTRNPDPGGYAIRFEPAPDRALHLVSAGFFLFSFPCPPPPLLRSLVFPHSLPPPCILLANCPVRPPPRPPPHHPLLPLP